MTRPSFPRTRESGKLQEAISKIPSPPVLGERARVRGQPAYSNLALETEAASTPHANPLPAAAGRGSIFETTSNSSRAKISGLPPSRERREFFNSLLTLSLEERMVLAQCSRVTRSSSSPEVTPVSTQRTPSSCNVRKPRARASSRSLCSPSRAWMAARSPSSISSSS